MILVNGVVFESGNFWGFFCGIMSAVCYSGMVIFNKKAKEIEGLENSMLQLFISFLLVAIFVVIRQGFIIKVEASSIIPLLVLGFINTGVGCYLYFSSLSKIPVQTISICGYLEPLSAVCLSAFFLNERLSYIQIIGAGLILGGAIYAELKQ